jgi:hypothetical protein
MRTAIHPTQLHFRRLASHFLSLTSGDRLLRFGSVLTDIDIVAYVERLFASAANVFVVVEPDQDISGVLALEFTSSDARLGLSVSSWARNFGIGKALLQRAGLLACARGSKTLFVPNLRFNTALQQLALSLGMNVACASGALAAIQPHPTNGHEVLDHGFAGRITLADDSLRPRAESEGADARAVEPASTSS